MAQYIGHIGSRGAALRRQRLFRRCRDCGELRLLIGFLCRKCYDRRNRLHWYATDAEFRRKCLERAARTRRRNGQVERKKKEECPVVREARSKNR